jgi:hypothetical protein
MTTDLTLFLDDEPGELARLGRVLGRCRVNIDGLCAVSSGGGIAEVHILVDDTEQALVALKDASIEVGLEQEVLIVDVDDRPGALAEIAERLGESGINIKLVYMATATRLVLAADDLARAKSVLVSA